MNIDFETTIANLNVRVEAEIYGVGAFVGRSTDEVGAEISGVYVLSNTSARKHVSADHHEELASIDVGNLMVWKGKDNAPVFVTEELEAEAIEEYHNGQWWVLWQRMTM